jgi:hypothetical protein
VPAEEPAEPVTEGDIEQDQIKKRPTAPPPGDAATTS